MATDKTRRKIVTLAAVGGATVAAGGAAAPFMMSLAPSRKTKGEGAPVDVDISALEQGRLHVVAWRRKPVWILQRTPDMISALANAAQDELLDPESEASLQPEYCANSTRSIKPEIFVAVGVCTHLGCSPGTNDPDGFLCACHGSYFDYAGRVLKGSPAPTNLVVPEHFYRDDNTIVVGTSTEV